MKESRNNKIGIEYSTSGDLRGLTGPIVYYNSIMQALNIDTKQIEFKFKKGKHTINKFNIHILDGDFFGRSFTYDLSGIVYKQYNINHWTNSAIYTINK